MLFLPLGGKLHIGGIDIAFSVPSSAELQISNPLYRPFLDRGPGAASSLRMSVRVQCDDWPPWQDLHKVFDTGDSWSLSRDEQNYWLNLAPSGCESPLWIARFKRGAQHVDLYCRAGAKEKNGKRVISLPLVYPLDQLLLMYYFARRRGLLAHAAAMVRYGKAFLFSGASGAGKSTFSELLVEAGTGKVLSDERMIVREIDGVMQVFGTPWAGTAGIARNGSAPLAGIFFLEHGECNRIEKIDAASAVDRMLPMISVPWYDPDTAVPIIAFAKRVFARVPAYEFRFTPDRSAIGFFWKFIKKNPV